MGSIKDIETIVLKLDINCETDNQNAVDQMNSLLSRHGIKITYSPQPPMAIINVFHQQLARNAGAVKKDIFMDDGNGPHVVTVGDIRRMQQSGMTASEISDHLGINRATYFRRKHGIESKNDDCRF